MISLTAPTQFYFSKPQINTIMKNTFLILLLLCGLLSSSCKVAPVDDSGKTTAIEQARKELLDIVEKQNTGATFRFEALEGTEELSVALVNTSVGQEIRLPKGDIELPIAYYLVKDQAGNTTATYNSRLVKSGKSILFEIVDLTTQSTRTLPVPSDIDDLIPAPVGEFDDLNECLLDYFRSSRYCELLAQANQTCETLVDGIICSLTDGNVFSVHPLIEPTSFACRLQIFTSHLPMVYNPA